MLVQLSGVPGSGKSTLARAIAVATGFVVVDTDVLKSALVDGGVAVEDAGRPAYGAALALSADLLAQERGVVFDSPCRYPELLASCHDVAREAGVRHAFIELWASDASALLPRLDARTPRISQVASSTDPVPGTVWEFGTPVDTLREWQSQLVHPERDWLRIDAGKPMDANIAEALAYLDPARPDWR